MKRTKSGCQTCRSRRVKCDETRPTCNNCVRRNLACSFELKFRWLQEEFDSTGNQLNEVKGKTEDEKNIVKVNKKTKGRRGPVSKRRKIGQEAVELSLFEPRTLGQLSTEMEEVPFDADDDMFAMPNLEMGQFRKFCFVPKSPAALPIRLHSPLYRACTVGDAALDSIEETLLAPPLYPEFDWDGMEVSHLDGFDPVTATATPGRPLSTRPTIGPTSIVHTVNPAEIIARSLKRRSFETENLDDTVDLPGVLSGFTEQDFFDYYVNSVADELVPIPFEENPLYKHLPLRAVNDKAVWELLVAYGASNMALQGGGRAGDLIRVDGLVKQCEDKLEALLDTKPQSNQALLSAALLSQLELERGRAGRWRHFLGLALEIVRMRPTFAAWELHNEVNSMLFRLIGFMVSMANLLAGPESKLLAFPSWPQWSGSLDHLTGIDLNLLPLFSEVAHLARSTESQMRNHKRQKPLANELQCMTSTRLLQQIRMRALRIIQRNNDYWIEEFRPDSDITAMCIMFQVALQIHVMRRVLLWPAQHPVVQRIMKLAVSQLEKWVAPAALIQRSMTFILVTLASEAVDRRHRAELLTRLVQIAQAGFGYHWQICEDLKRHWSAGTSLIMSQFVFPR